MFNRRGGWWQLWRVLAVIWTLVAGASAWIDLPRARYMPHDPEFLSKLSIEASSILRGPAIAATPVRGELVWPETPRIVRMLNGTRLTFPALTTDKLAAIVDSEYRQLLSVQADEQTGPYVVERLALWLAPLAIAGMAASLVRRGYRSQLVRGTADKTDGGIMRSSTVLPVPASYRRSADANGEGSRVMFANER